MTDNVKIIIEPAEEGGYVAHCPALKGCWSQGETLDEVKGNIREAIDIWLEARLLLDLRKLLKKNQASKPERKGKKIQNIRISLPRFGLASSN